MKNVLVIPARLKSTRLPRKPLIKIKGKTVIERTYTQCIKAVAPENVYVVTDSDEIFKHCRSFGAKVVMTSESCLTGTDRVAEFSKEIEADYYINVQGDEPLINPEDITKVNASIENNKGKIINGYAPIDNEFDYRSKSIPKVVFRQDGRLLYMSRSPIPSNKENIFIEAWRQICIYAFPKSALNDFSILKQKTRLENNEDIEILRFLEMGYEVYMIELSSESIAVDTIEDLQKVEKKLMNEK
ncbi:3-deoxy-manno-octulosonate cytidylyltransferase [Chloroherpeton thalassium ATCC 35110]|uniref:3-deoxy-manno-octulosonate cytidylyltransferase n=1 Tax=Chloroherpeton thalassium (strain ATCC 35110 / GB-78) TaxID=517418 RepID=B3QVJ0_CHLT3|nr:3-deoxy-manno-octulosonate cytidylyltransferase [Chloroherpeton thalassium]ACF14590.1 3-deoxy-manno-octulosonate cytidylyltransferase [Chloroherpeton thalassium ATCC 35110]